MGKIEDLKHFAEQNSLDIILIQETHLRPGSRSPKINNYNFYKTDKIFNDNTRRDMYPGGTAIFIKKHIPHHHIPTPDLAPLKLQLSSFTLKLHSQLSRLMFLHKEILPLILIETFSPLNDFNLLHNRFTNYFLGR
ncbi:hypothetical protein CEXT_468821 [Caerostris extrusa]|uniref:Endonuclease/exonuclease/phosphatase domain-containing protein n=1 Tax=Caerostris extrusa TaxID=172846 RepID=A0AAV4V524_CAEEX|nr:hypothetical protein CEXT_468821 [Caerostris extrusa]